VFDDRVIIDLTVFSDRSRDVARKINFGVKLPTPPSFVTLALQTGLEDCNFDFSILNGNDFSILCTNLVTFVLVTSEIATFATIATNWLFEPNIEEYWTDLDQIFRAGRHMDADNKTYISFAVVQWTLLW